MTRARVISNGAASQYAAPLGNHMIYPQPKKLLEFTKLTHVAFCAYSISRHALTNLGNEMRDNPKINIDGITQIGGISKSKKRDAIAELPTDYVLGCMMKDALFSQMIAESMLLWVYALWNDKYRGEIAKELSVEKSSINSDVMGDLRLIRNAISHKQGKVNHLNKSLKVIKLPQAMDLFMPDFELMDHIQRKINTMQLHDT